MKVLEDRVYALEGFIEKICPLLIAASPAKEQVAGLLRSWTERSTSDPVEVLQADLAGVLLQALEPKAGT
jgi:hypothetical protein